MAATAPTGTATVVLGDVAGSTRLWQSEPEGMELASRRLAELLDELTGRHGGYRPREQGEGDNLVATFAAAADAVAFAVALDRALATEDWPADLRLAMRIGIHTGDVVWDRDIGYLGPTFNRCARLRDLGRARMILLSQTTRDVVEGQLPDDVELVDLGSHQLRDLSRTERVHQLRHAGSPAEFRPLKSVTVLPNNLPVPVTSLLGRDEDIAHVVALFADHRLVTLTGAGGSGKTRVAQHVASEVLPFAPDGAWWVDLLPVTDDTRVPVVVAEAVGIEDVVASSRAAEVVAAGIDDQRLLLVLDNCEHVIDAAADLVEVLLQRCPHLVVLATSRETLDVPGEHSVRVRPLAVPDGDDATLATLEGHAATGLFLERATTLDRDALDATQRRAVVDVCRRLDGIPLAIELAAARTRLLSVTEVEAGLDDRFGLLTGGRRGRRAAARQRTLESSIAWSFDLLADDEETMLCRLAVFPSSFDLDGARAVGAPETPAAALDLLGSLVDKSLVAARPSDGGRPYRLLESIRDYAGQRLRTRGEERDARLAHLRHTIDRVEALVGRGSVDQFGLGRVVQLPPALRDDLFAAEATALATGRHTEAIDLYWPLFMSVIFSGDHRAATPAMTEVVAAGDLDLVDEARALALLVACLGSANRHEEVIALADRAVRAARELAAAGTPELLQPVLTTVAHATSFAGRPGAGDLAREAMAVSRDLAARRGEVGWSSYAAPWCAVALAQDGFEAEGMDVAADGLADAEVAGFDHLAALCAIYLAVISMRLRPMDECRRLFRAARERIPADAPRLHALLAGTGGVWCAVLTGDHEGAAAWLQHGLDHAGPPGSGTHLLMANASVVERLGCGDADEAVALGEQVAARVAGTDNRWWLLHTRWLVARAEVEREGPGAAAALAAAKELLPPGRTFPALTWMVQETEGRLRIAEGRPADALEFARDIVREGDGAAVLGRLQMALPLAVAAFAALGEATSAARALGAVERFTLDTGRVDLHPATTAAAATGVRTALGQTAFDEAHSAGATMSVDDVVAWLADGAGSG